MTTPINTGHLRQVGLSLPEVKTITLVAQHGGEVEWHGENASPVARGLIAQLVTQKLIEHVNRGTALTPRPMIRFTDQGRAVAAQLEAMAIKPSVEVKTA